MTDIVMKGKQDNTSPLSSPAHSPTTAGAIVPQNSTVTFPTSPPSPHSNTQSPRSNTPIRVTKEASVLSNGNKREGSASSNTSLNDSQTEATDQVESNISFKREKLNSASSLDGHQGVQRRRSSSMLEVKEHAHSRLREELMKAQKDLKLKDEEVRKLNRVQEQMGMELEELTASLFEEANNMVQDANVKRMNSEKLLKESNAKIDVLQAEVTALKTLVITSTPSMPNRHLHPQLESNKKPNTFIKGHRRSTSHHNLNKDIQFVEVAITPEQNPQKIELPDNRELDQVFFEDFTEWRRSPKIDPESAFLARILHEDIKPCLDFKSSQLSKSVYDCVLKNMLTIEPVPEKCPFPRTCALSEKTCVCKYRIRLADSEPWLFISQLARNRITSVCDFLAYARYITQGLVKSDEKEAFWEIIRLRKQMALAKLGLS